MATGKQCPVCKSDIGLAAIDKGSLVTLSGNRFRCPHCETKLRYAGWGIDPVFAVMMIPAVGVSLVLAFTFIPSKEMVHRMVFSIVGVTLLSPLALFPAALYVRKHKTLITVQDDAAGQTSAS
jgi:hypothetical protein